MQSVFQPNRCRVLSAAALLISLAMATGIGAAGEVRYWIYRPPAGGREVKFEAEFFGLKGVAVMLKTPDGKDYEPPLASLSEDDVRYVEKMSRTDQGEFIHWTDALGNELKVRYAGIAGQAVMLATQEGGSLQIPWDRLDATQKAYVINAQQVSMAAKGQAAEAARQWTRLEDGIEVATLNADTFSGKRIGELMFSPNGAMLFSNDNMENSIWSTVKLRRQCRLDTALNKVGNSCFRAEAFHNRFDATGQQIWWFSSIDFERWDSISGKLLTHNNGFIELERLRQVIGLASRTKLALQELRCAPNGRFIAVAPYDESGEKHVYLLDPSLGKVQEVLVGAGDNRDINLLAFSANSRILAGCEGFAPYGLDVASRFHIWNLVTKQHCVIENYYGYFGNLVDNGQLLGIFREDEMYLFQTATGKLEHNYKFPKREKGNTFRVAISPVGRCVAIAHGDRIYLDDWARGTNIVALELHEAPVTAMTFSLDGSLLATGDAQGRIKLWKLTGLVNNANKSDPAATTEPPKPADDKTAAPTTSPQSSATDNARREANEASTGVGAASAPVGDSPESPPQTE